MMYDLSKWLQLYLFKVKPKKIIVLKQNYGQAPSLGVTNYRHPDITIKKSGIQKKKLMNGSNWLISQFAWLLFDFILFLIYIL